MSSIRESSASRSSIRYTSSSNADYRSPRSDEVSVFLHFSAHAGHCDRCGDPYRTFLAGGTLCNVGHAYAWEVTRIAYYYDGRLFLVSDRSVEISIPRSCDVIHALLKAVDRGLKVERKTLIVSHTTYDVPERMVTTRREYEVVEKKQPTHYYTQESPQIDSRALVVVKKSDDYDSKRVLVVVKKDDEYDSRRSTVVVKKDVCDSEDDWQDVKRRRKDQHDHRHHHHHQHDHDPTFIYASRKTRTYRR